MPSLSFLKLTWDEYPRTSKEILPRDERKTEPKTKISKVYKHCRGEIQKTYIYEEMLKLTNNQIETHIKLMKFKTQFARSEENSNAAGFRQPPAQRVGGRQHKQCGQDPFFPKSIYPSHPGAAAYPKTLADTYRARGADAGGRMGSSITGRVASETVRVTQSSERQRLYLYKQGCVSEHSTGAKT